MDISSTSTVSAAEVSTSASQTQKTTSKSDSSFKDEMKKVSDTENKETEKTEEETNQKTDTVENKTDEKSEQDDNSKPNNEQNQKLSGEISMVAGQNQLNQNRNLDMQNNTIQALMDANARLADITRLGSGLGEAKVDYSNINMSADDAKFFSDLVQNTDKTLQGVVNDLKTGAEQNVQKASQHVKVSASLMNALNDAVKNNQPVRINLDKDVSIIIKVDKDGALSATFIPGDKAVEEYLRQNISTLRQRFDEQELSYRDLSYSRQKQNQEQHQEQNRRNKENADE